MTAISFQDFAGPWEPCYNKYHIPGKADCLELGWVIFSNHPFKSRVSPFILLKLDILTPVMWIMSREGNHVLYEVLTDLFLKLYN